MKNNNNYYAYYLYVESSYNKEFNSYIREHYTRLVDIFNNANYGFIYLPELLKSEDFNQIVAYNRPYLKQLESEEQIQQIYNALLDENEHQEDGGFFFLYNNQRVNKIVHFNIELFDEDKVLKNYLINDWESRFSNNNEVLYSLNEPLAHYSYSLDYDFEAEEIAEDIEIKIARLYERGAIELIAEIIERVQEKIYEETLSTLYINDDYRFYLKDYGMKEVKIGPLAKSLYILYLKHPEGIRFKELIEYRDELLSIYVTISSREDLDEMKQSIIALTSPESNSINENSSRIKEAFVKQITGDLASEYYITGGRGKKKLIHLDRSLVEYQTESLRF